MIGFWGSITRVRLIAGNTFLEAVRQKFFNALLLISIARKELDLGSGEKKLRKCPTCPKMRSNVGFARSHFTTPN